jgi:hypothetical protein
MNEHASGLLKGRVLIQREHRGKGTVLEGSLLEGVCGEARDSVKE